MTEISLEEFVKVAGPVSRETFQRIELFVERFRRWNRVTNLVAASTIDDLWRRHVLDSAQLLAIAPGKLRWVDLGSGGGFPGLVLAMLLREQEGSVVHLVESNRKKAAFLASVVGEMSLRAEVHAARIEDTWSRIQGIEAVCSRALARTRTLLDLSQPWLAAGATAYFHKGRDCQREIEEISHLWQFQLIEHRSMVESASVVLEISNVRRV